MLPYGRLLEGRGGTAPQRQHAERKHRPIPKRSRRLLHETNIPRTYIHCGPCHHLRVVKFAIVDIETTGGSNKSRGITEIGIVVTDGTQVLKRWTSFDQPHLNPSRRSNHRPDRDLRRHGGRCARIRRPRRGRRQRCSAIVSLWPTTWGSDYAFIRGHFQCVGHTVGNGPNSAPSASRAKPFPDCRGMDCGALCDARGHHPRRPTSRDGRCRSHGRTVSPDYRLRISGQAAIAEALERGTREHWMPQHVKASEYDALPDERWRVLVPRRARPKPLYIGA